MFRTAAARFWRGVREPWELLGRMREHRSLWARYWRIVLVQAAVTLVAGAAVFWLGRQGADAWNDAFGSDEPLAEVAQPSTQTPSTPAPGATGPSTVQKSASGAPPPVAPPGAPQAAAPPGKGTPRAPPAPPPGAQKPSSARTSTDEADEAEDDADDAADEDATDSELEAQIKALQNAPPGERRKRTADLVAAAVVRAQKQAARAGRHKDKPDDPSDLADDRQEVKERIEEVTVAAEALARQPPSAAESRKARRQLEKRLNDAEKEAGRLERRGAPALTDAERAQLARARAAFATLRRHERGILGRLSAVLALLTAIWASLTTAQTGVLALSRDFHDALSRELSLLVNVAPEDPPLRPKIRLDVPWVRRKANRRWQFLLGFLPGTALITLVGWFLHSRTFTTVLTAVWAAYWWMVMTAGQSARAWSPPETTPRPWYLRGWFQLTDRFILFRWGVPRMWGRIWERMARRFYGPAERVEEQPLEFAGLALSRSLTLIPGLKLLLRPIFPVSAAHLLVEHAATARLPVPVTAAEVADAAAHAPDPEARAHSGTLATAQPVRSPP